jgi:cytidine diphosphoramidate kinase
MVIWLVGMYASGKSTLAEEIRDILRQSNNNVLVLNGGDLRKILGNDLSYTLEDRMLNARHISGVCQYLGDQGMIVICSMLSLFEETRQWNRKNIYNYYEIYIDVSMKQLLARDSKNLYRKALNGDTDQVVGVDIEFIKPENSDLILDNNKDRQDLSDLAKKVINIINV